MIEKNITTPFPPHFPSADLVDRMAVVWKEWRRDNGLYCLDLLEGILDDYPWSRDASDFYGLVSAKTRHVFSLKATLRLHEWIAEHQQVQNQPYRVDDNVWRVKQMMDVLRLWLSPQNVIRNDDQWAVLADIGGQQGEVCNRFIGIPGIKFGIVIEPGITNCSEGEKYYHDPRQFYVNAVGGGFELKLPLQTNSLDVAVLSGVLEHVLEPDLMVSEAERATKPGGLIIIQVPYGGMEGGQVNPGADNLSFRSHVRSINPYRYLENRKVLTVQYRCETNNPHSPHTWYGEVGDWVVAYENSGK